MGAVQQATKTQKVYMRTDFPVEDLPVGYPVDFPRDIFLLLVEQDTVAVVHESSCSMYIVCMVTRIIIAKTVWINRVRLPILLLHVVS